MFEKKECPILEFDDCAKAMIEPSSTNSRIDGPERCVLTFFGEVIAAMLEAGKLKQIGLFRTATINLPVYETEWKGEKVAMVQAFLGSAGAAGQLEDLIAMGFTKFMVCGGAGVLQRGIQVGHLVLPSSAVRDEGASYHYAPPSREIACNPHAVSVAEHYLSEKGIPFIKAKTWTTDGFYRETPDKLALRVSEGCVTVEMEASAFFAVAAFRNVILGQILYCGDDLSGTEWDSRLWDSRGDIRKNLVEATLDICLRL